ncbi:MAG: heavy metal transporter [Anaerolineales bacterium]|nr:heavy-metal-associated domain-containing protein [Anaerolineae bacterium]PWB52997.1 MAG: heavy metal transporter [Anaerolineales bacterium]
MTSKVTYSIPNIHCGHCVHTIQSELIELPGVKSVKADLNLRNATIEFEPPASEQKIKELLTSIDYPSVG